MDHEFDRCHIKIRTILGIDAKTIHEELTTALGPNIPSILYGPQVGKPFSLRKRRCR